jgi:predicted enzyme related to lactoylglutathione lyase
MGKVKKFAFTLYPTKDLARARRFYEDLFGLEVSDNYSGRWIEYTLGDGVFAITDMVEMRPASDAGGSIAFEVDDVDAATAEVRGYGSRVLVEPMSTPVCRLAVVEDSEGNALTLHHVTG